MTKQVKVDIPLETHTLLWSYYKVRKNQEKEKGNTFTIAEAVNELLLFGVGIAE